MQWEFYLSVPVCLFTPHLSLFGGTVASTHTHTHMLVPPTFPVKENGGMAFFLPPHTTLGWEENRYGLNICLVSQVQFSPLSVIHDF